MRLPRGTHLLNATRPRHRPRRGLRRRRRLGFDTSRRASGPGRSACTAPSRTGNTTSRRRAALRLASCRWDRAWQDVAPSDAPAPGATWRYQSLLFDEPFELDDFVDLLSALAG